MLLWKSLFRKRIIPLKDALHFLQATHEVVLRLRQNKHYIPEEEDFILLFQIFDEAQRLRLSAMHLHQCFHARANGSAEPDFRDF